MLSMIEIFLDGGELLVSHLLTFNVCKYNVIWWNKEVKLMQRLEAYSFTPVVNQHDSDHGLSRNIPCDISIYLLKW